MRIASLLPSATETLYALGVEPVGVSHACTYPPAAAERPTLTRSRVDATGGCGDVDTQVQEATDEHGGVFEIDDETLRAVDPDLVVTQGVCDVCAVDRVLVEERIADLGLDAAVLTTDAHHLSDVLDDVRRIGAAAGRERRAADIAADLEARIRRVEEVAADADASPRVTVLDWLDPTMVAGHWIPEMVDRIGAEYGLADPGSYSGPTAWEDVRSFDPEVLVAAPCGFSLAQCLDDATALTAREGWQSLSAVRTDRAYAMDGDGHVNCPGPRLVDTLEYLAALVHPTRFESPPTDVVSSLPVRTPA